jgi:hypothetical protein
MLGEYNGYYHTGFFLPNFSIHLILFKVWRRLNPFKVLGSVAAII